MSAWRDETRIPAGMQDTKRWWRPAGVPRFLHPADVDAIVWDGGEQFIMMEFKPAINSITTGQEITLRSFSKKEGCMAIVIIDSKWNQEGAEFSQDDVITTVPFVNGKRLPARTTTIGKLNQRLKEWEGNIEKIDSPEVKPGELGMSNFPGWFTANSFIASIDGVIHNGKGRCNNFMFMSFSPDQTPGFLSALTRKDAIQHTAFADPYPGDKSRKKYDDSETIVITLFSNGEVGVWKESTVAAINATFSEWCAKR